MKNLGANKVSGRGLYDRYMTSSVLSAANKDGSKIDKRVAEIMNAESKEFSRSDIVMVPSMKANTGWKYVDRNQLDLIREYR